MLNNHGILRNISRLNRERVQESLFDQLLKNLMTVDKSGKQTLHKLEIQRDLEMFTIFWADPLDIQMDTMMNSVISVCLDYDSPGSVADQTKYFIEYLLQRPPSRWNNTLLMSVLLKVCESECPPASYSKFLTSH